MSQRRKPPSRNPAKGTNDVRGEVMGHMRAYEQGDPNVLLDTSRAVLLDAMDVCRIDAFSHVTDKTNRQEAEKHEMIAMVLEGRVNKSRERAKVMWMFDVDGAAAIITELMALATRMGPEFTQLLHERIEKLEDMGAVGAQPSPQPVDPDDFYKVPER
jgi:hypothetical protein